MEGDAPKSKRNTSHRRKISRSVVQRSENDRPRMSDKVDERLKQRSTLFDIPNWSEVLDHLRGGPLQSIMLNDLNELLSYATEDLLYGFDCPSFLQALSQLLYQPQEYNGTELINMHNDPNFQMACSDCIHMILDIFPNEAKFFDSNPKYFGFITSKLSQIEYVDLAEKLLSIIEKVSRECPNVIIVSNAIPNILEYIDFYPITPQVIALETISRALSAASTSNYDDNVKPSLLSISQFILHQNERIRESCLLCFKSLASNAMINDPNVNVPCFIFHKMKELIDTEIAIANAMNNDGDFKISKSVLDVVDISVAFITSSNTSAIRNTEESGLVESISKLFYVFIPQNYRATNLFALARLLQFLDQLIAITDSGECDKRVLDHFSPEMVKQLLVVTKCSLIKSFDHVNQWLGYGNSCDFGEYKPVKLPINHMNKQIQLEIVSNGETTRLLSRPFLSFNRIISYILKNEQVSLPFQLCLSDLESCNPIIMTIESEELKYSLLELLIRVNKGKTIEDIWHNPHIFEIIYPIDYQHLNSKPIACNQGMARLFTFSFDRYEKLEGQFASFRALINKYLLDNSRQEDNAILFDKLIRENTKLPMFTPQVEIFMINDVADTAMLGVNPWIINAVSLKPELFSLALRRLLFYLEGPNLSRSLSYIQTIIKSSLDTRLIVSNREGASSITSAIAAFEHRLMKHYHYTLNTSTNKTFSESENRLTDRVKVNIDRNNLLRGTAEAFKQINFDTQPIIEFCLVDENGIGTGPTLEVYNLILEQLRDLGKTIVPVFSTNVNNGVFPAPLNQGTDSTLKANNSLNGDPTREASNSNNADSSEDDYLPFFDIAIGCEEGNLDVKSNTRDNNSDVKSNSLEKSISRENNKRLLFGWWHFIGQLVACAMLDQRSLDIRLSPLFWSLVKTGNDISYDPFSVDNINSIGFSAKDRSLRILSLFDAEMAKSLANLQLLSPQELKGYLREHGYGDLASYYQDILAAQFDKYAIPIFAFRHGFSTVLPLYTLNLFTSYELSDWWYNDYINFDLDEARNYIMADHGYTQESKPFIWLLEVLSEFNSDEIRLFLKFCTGSPILPHGGFKNLKPLMCVVKKPIENNQPYALPSVMTCTNYLKLPDYPNKELLRKMLLYAINEGQNEFELS